MSAERYSIHRLDSEPEILDSNYRTKVEPFPIRRWNQPLPIAVEGEPLPHPNNEKSASRTLTKFYPPLLLLSTALTGTFLYLYLSKPVILERPPVEMEVRSRHNGIPASVSQATKQIEEELSPFPEELMVPGDELPGSDSAILEEEGDSVISPTNLSVERVVQISSLSGELEEVKITLPVHLPEELVSWDERAILQAENLAAELDAHLMKVNEIQAAGVKLLEGWNLIMASVTPQEILATDPNEKPKED